MLRRSLRDTHSPVGHLIKMKSINRLPCSCLIRLIAWSNIPLKMSGPRVDAESRSQRGRPKRRTAMRERTYRFAADVNAV